MVLRVEADPADVKRCDKARRILPALPLPRLLARGDAVFEELVETLEKPPIKERPENAWVCPGTWSLVDRRTELRKAGLLTQRESRRLARAIRTLLKLDRQERASKADKAIMMELLAGNIKEAWKILKPWHQKAGGAATEPCHASKYGAADGGGGGALRLPGFVGRAHPLQQGSRPPPRQSASRRGD